MRGKIPIADDGLAAQWASWRTRLAGRPTPLAALGDGNGPQLLFAEGELLVDAADEQTMALLRERAGVDVAPPGEVPQAPEGLDPEKARSLEGMPRIAKARFDGKAIGEEPLVEILDERGLGGGDVSVSSPGGLGTLSLAAELALRGGRVMPNAVGEPVTLPRAESAEDGAAPGGPDAYTWPEFAGRFRLPRAWQLIEAYRQLRTTASPSIDVGILDGGFWLVDGMPGAPPGRPPEFPAPALQWNLQAPGQHAGGPNPASGFAWHGQLVASVAVAPHDDGVGVAGAGGTVARPFMFKSDLTCDQVIEAVKLATAWGLDVMNMSFRMVPALGLFGDFDESGFNDMFRWGADNGLVIVAAAGNDGRLLPGYDIRPATRTPGVITVGGLDGDVAWAKSNFGVSVDIWAQGSAVHAGATPVNPQVSLASGTSVAAPIVAGVAAMMKFVDPTLKTPAILQLLQDNGWRGSPDPKVNVGLDAAAAIWDLIGRRLPADFGETDSDPGSARPLQIQPDGTLASSSIGARAISVAGDVDWYVFSLEDFTLLTVELDYAAGLASASVTIVPDDPESRAPGDLGETRSFGRHRLGPALIAPGTYRLKVTGGVTLYELRVKALKTPLLPDRFEINDTLEQATLFTLQTSSPQHPWDNVLHLGHRRGTYELNLHKPSDVDFLHVTDVPATGILEPIFEFSRTDRPLDIALVDVNGAVQAEWNGVRALRLVLPEGEAFVRVSGHLPTQYTLRLSVEADPTKLPGPWQTVPVSPFPEWWPDPPWELHGWEQYLQVVLDPELVRAPGLRLSGHPGLTLDLLAQDGSPIASSERIGDGELHLPLDGVQPGDYLIRVGRDVEPAARLAPAAMPPASFRLGPVL